LLVRVVTGPEPLLPDPRFEVRVVTGALEPFEPPEPVVVPCLLVRVVTGVPDADVGAPLAGALEWMLVRVVTPAVGATPVAAAAEWMLVRVRTPDVATPLRAPWTEAR
jgi:hypothetical protein